MTTGVAPLGRVLPRRSRREFHVVIGPHSRRGRSRYWVALSLVVAMAFLGSVYARIALDRSAFDLADVERQIAVEEERYRELRLQVSELQSPDVIAERAAELGMVYPESVATIVVPGLGGPGPNTDERWIDLKGLLSAQP